MSIEQHVLVVYAWFIHCTIGLTHTRVCVHTNINNCWFGPCDFEVAQILLLVGDPAARTEVNDKGGGCFPSEALKELI